MLINILEARYLELIEAEIYMTSIMSTIGATSPCDALTKIKEATACEN